MGRVLFIRFISVAELPTPGSDVPTRSIVELHRERHVTLIRHVGEACNRRWKHLNGARHGGDVEPIGVARVQGDRVGPRTCVKVFRVLLGRSLPVPEVPGPPRDVARRGISELNRQRGVSCVRRVREPGDRCRKYHDAFCDRGDIESIGVTYIERDRVRPGGHVGV